MELLLKEINKSVYDPHFYNNIDKDQLIKCISRCKFSNESTGFISCILNLESNLESHTFQELINSKYNYNGMNEELFKDLLDTRLFIKSTLSNQRYNYTKQLDDDFYTRCYIRIMLIKEGWKPLNIENFIKINFGFNYLITRYKFTYLYITAILNIETKENSKGRPRLPTYLKNILDPLLKTKNRKRMKEIYDISKELNGLFSISEIDNLIKLTNDKSIIKKLDILKKYSVSA